MYMSWIVWFFCVTFGLIYYVVGVMPVWVGGDASPSTFVGLNSLWFPSTAMSLASGFFSGSFMGFFSAHWLSEGADLRYSLVPGIWHFLTARVLLLFIAVVSCWKICHILMVLKWLFFCVGCIYLISLALLYMTQRSNFLPNRTIFF